MKLKVYNAAGETVRSAALDPSIFNVRLQPELVQRAVRAQTANRRTAVAHTKTKSEVRGGGKKPWRQKGTGRARHGSIRSPLWAGGGITFGPRPDRNFSVAMNKKEMRKALSMVLSEKARAEHIVLMDGLAVPDGKTRQLALLLKRLPVNNARTTLIVQPTPDDAVRRSARNMQRVSTILANSLNVLDVLRHDYLLMPEASLDVIGRTYGTKKK